MTERFTLLTELGRGGMGVVWKARDEETGSIVALKLLRETYAEDPDYVVRFERELDLLRRIKSEHVVRVLGFGVRDKTPYLALEYVDGPSLHQSLATHGPYTWPEARALLIQIAQGLVDAHTADVLHRDVKPSNVLIGTDGLAKLTDFGIARGLDLSRMTATSTMLGTPAYLAPEGPVDTRSDLYSLGIIGYELMSGAPPFVGSTYQQIILAHVRTPPDLERIPAEARAVIGWLLAKDAEDRPQNGQELLAVLLGRLLLPSTAERPNANTPSRATASTPPRLATPEPPESPVAPTASGALNPYAYYGGQPVGRDVRSGVRVRYAGRFARGNSMDRQRVDHAASLLPDGRVLITGGWDQVGAWSLAEVFDPVSGNVSEAGKASWARKGHTATLLRNGRVLVAGGCDSTTTFSSAEMFDQTTGAFLSVPPMQSARESHTATLLPNGHILVVGGSGRDSSVAIADIEEFDPVNGIFRRVGELLVPRSRHVATLLSDGRVLITGGSAGGRFVDRAESYDPRAQESFFVGRLTTPRRDHTAVSLQDGRVLVAGGTDETQLASAESYVPGTVGFTYIGSMREHRSRHTATVLPDGRVLLAGGVGSDGPTGSSELFDPGSNSFTPNAPMAVARAGHTATLLGTGKILIAGGIGIDGTPIASTEVYAS
jgi:hypothetical protein